MLATRCEPQYSQQPVRACANPGEGYADSSRIMCSDASTVEFGGPSHQAQTRVSSFDFSSAPFVLQSSRATLSSSNSVVSSSSLVSVCSGEDESFPNSSDYYRAGEQSAIPIFSKEELKILSRCLPHTKIKKIIKCSGAVNHMIGSEVPALLAIACELFVRDLTSFSWSFTKRANRRTVQAQDIKSVSSRDFRFRRLLNPKADQSKNTLAFPGFSAGPAHKDADPPLSVPRATQAPHAPGPPASSERPSSGPAQLQLL
ncbi:CCAAT-binding factor chain HAP5 like histone [Cryptosporidium canis]|uniref:CCAAT-binding factor chain HAP5 like histone n=1 Tax=Cryptosporidium canis TaxID=195482 RepID=A0ABQ8P238_9CRYT|nr:CCAAT-binding factor chain HAP5 like histone [Cryptosporidium canis]